MLAPAEEVPVTTPASTMSAARSVLFFIVAVARGGVDGNAYHDLVANESKENVLKLEQLIDDKVPGINERGQGGQTPLMMGCLMGKYNAVEKLLKAGADYTIAEKDGYTPMHGCAFQGRADVCKLLIDFGLDPSLRHTDGFTPIHRACWGDTPMHTVAVKVFLEAGVDPEERPIKDGKQGPLCVEMSNNDATKRMLKTWMEKKKDEL